MAASPKIKENLSTLREDATRVLSDISNLTKKLSEAGAEKSGEMKDNLLEGLEEQLGVLRERLEALNSDMRQNAQKADTHVRGNPYSYILAALGLGAVLGKLLFPRQED